jgi:hypothetical protein
LHSIETADIGDAAAREWFATNFVVANDPLTYNEISKVPLSKHASPAAAAPLQTTNTFVSKEARVNKHPVNKHTINIEHSPPLYILSYLKDFLK